MTTTPADIARRALADHLAALPPDALLNRYIARRDPEAFAGLVQQFGPMVLGTCRRVLGSSADVDDAFQAVFLSLARQAESFRDAHALPAWLHRVALRVSHKALARRAPASVPPEAVPDPADPFADVAWKDVRRVLDEELDRLPEKYRAPVVLCWLDGLTQDEAAGKVSVSLATLKRRLDAGRELLRVRLVRRGLAPVLAAATVATPAGLHAVVPESLKVLAVELGVGGAVPSGVVGLEVLVSVAAPTRRVILAALLGVGAVATGGIAYAWNRSRRPPPEVAKVPQPEPRRVTAPRVRLALKNPVGEIPAVRWAPDGKRIATWNNGTARLWDAITGKEVAAPQPIGLWSAMALHPGGNLLAYRIAHESIKVRDFEKGRDVATLKPHRNPYVGGPVWSPDGKTLATVEEGTGARWGGPEDNQSPTLRLWDIATQQAREIKLDGQLGGALSYSPNGKVLALVNQRDGFAQFRDVANGSKVAEHRFPHPVLVNFGTTWWSEESTTFFALIVAWGQTHPLRSFSLVTGTERAEELHLVAGKTEEEMPQILDWSEDGNVCVWMKKVGTETVLVIEDWRAQRMRASADAATTIWPEPRRNGEVARVMLSRDGNTLLTFRDGDILLWDVSPLK